MVNMEFIQFQPVVGLWPGRIYRDHNAYSLLYQLHGIFYNKIGERFMERYYPEQKDFATRQETARAINREVREGRGLAHGGVYLCFRHLPRNLINDFIEDQGENPFLNKLKESGIDIREDAIEVGPAALYVAGGCWINEACETSLEGLYAIGEVGSGGKDGADRLSANSLPFCMAMGCIGGKEAANRAGSIPPPT